MRSSMEANLERRLSGRIEGGGRRYFGLFADVRHLLGIWSHWKRRFHVNGHSEYAKLVSRYTEQITFSTE
jgi:hypothetical protein